MVFSAFIRVHLRFHIVLLGVLGALGGSILVLVFLRVLSVLRVSAFNAAGTPGPRRRGRA